MQPFITGQPAPQTHRRPTRLNRFLFGAPYYPEHWDPALYESDVERMAEAHFNVVRMAEFAWDRMEPVEGQYDFSLFRDIAARMGARDIGTMLCTPTATAPRWLTAEHPEVLRVMPNGLRCTHGSRQQACYSNPLYRAYSVRITRAMAEAFADDPNVIGWQTDNEFNCGFSECCCPSCQDEFRRFLRAKYGTIEALNEAWGTAFWAQTYRNFGEIDLPYEGRPGGENPSARLDYYRYLSFIIVRFQREQVEILREVNPDWLLTHNGTFGHLDYWTFCQDLDFLGFDNYPCFTYDAIYGGAEPPERADGAGHVASRLDTARSYAGNFIVPEQQSGPGGGKGYMHNNPRPGEMRLWSYQAMAHGADGIMHFRWRTCRFGAEEYWCGILDHDSVPRRRYAEAQQEGAEFAALSDQVLGTHVHVDAGILGSVDQDDAHSTLHHALPTPSRAGEHLHRALWRKKYAVGYVDAADTFDGLKLLVWPHLPMCDTALADKVAAYVHAGGTLLIGGRSAVKDTDNRVTDLTPPGLLAALAGATVEEYGIRPERQGYRIRLNSGETVPAVGWYDWLKPTTARVLATWEGGHLAGAAAVTENRYGAGRVIYAGTLLTAETAPWIAALAAEAAGLAPLAQGLPDEVEVTLRCAEDRRLLFVLNHESCAQQVQGLPAGTELLTGAALNGTLALAPFGVAVIALKG